jgi:uncharacterized membrane protein YkoI
MKQSRQLAGQQRAMSVRLAATAVFTMLVCASAQSRGPDDAGADLARRLLIEGKILPLEQIIGRARSVREGSLIDAELSFEDDHAGYVYELHMLDGAGDVWELEFKADTGELIEHKPIDH